MYAGSLVGSLRRVDKILDEALTITSFRNDSSALWLADEAISVIDDLGEQTSVALPRAGIDGHDRKPSDEAVEKILTVQFDEGIGAPPNDAVLESAVDAGRVDRVNETVLVPIGDEMPGIRNWWVLVDLAIDWLDEIHAGFVRMYQRGKRTGSPIVETAYWSVVDRLRALQDALSQARTIGRYVNRSVQRSHPERVTAVSNFVTTLAE